nr:nitrilase-related carbon-nitrogen hydrolase [Parageobacillus thermoglucosidasius]
MDRLESVKVAAVQFESRLGDLEGNRHRMLELAEEAAENGAKLIVFPEMATSGYIFENRQEIAPYVEPIPGPTTELFQTVAKSIPATWSSGCRRSIHLPKFFTIQLY